MSKFQLFVKESCGTCKLIEPLLPELLRQLDVELVSQDDPNFPEGYAVTFDENLERSYRANIEIVPTLIKGNDSGEVSRVHGWDKAAWQEIAGLQFPSELPLFQPGCGSKTPRSGYA